MYDCVSDVLPLHCSCVPQFASLEDLQPLKRLDVLARGPKALPRPVDCTSEVCASNLQALKRETADLLHHVEKLEALLLAKSTVTSDHLELAKRIRAEYVALGKTPNESQIKNLSKRLNKERAGLDVEEDLDILVDEPLLPAEPEAPHPLQCPPGLIDLDSDSDIGEPSLAKEPDPQHPRDSPPALEDIVDDSDSDGLDSDVVMDELEEAYLDLEPESCRPPQHSRAVEPPQNPPADRALAPAADSPSPPSSPLSDTGLGDSD